MSTKSISEEFHSAVRRLRSFVGSSVMVEISPSRDRVGEFVSLPRLRLVAVEFSSGEVDLQFSSVAGDHVGRVEIHTEFVSYAHDSDASVEVMEAGGTVFTVWKSEKLTEGNGWTDSENWKEFGLPRSEVKSTPHEALQAGHIDFDSVVELLSAMVGKTTRLEVRHEASGDYEVVSFPDVDIRGVDLVPQEVEAVGRAVVIHLGKESKKWFSATVADRLLVRAEHDGRGLRLSLNGTVLFILDPMPTSVAASRMSELDEPEF